jgi:glyoxylase-like metal-dependent hydrolase (beta-lactamase superfamily II)
MINRRQLLQSGIAAGTFSVLLPGLTHGAFAAAPLAGAQAPGFYRHKLGSLEITTLLDGYAPLNAEAFLGTPPEEIERILAAHAMTTDLPTPVQAFVINSGERTYLVDAGIGATQMFGPTLGRMQANLEAAGISTDQIDAVILTHAHPDHADGLIDAEGNAVFANAEVVLNAVERNFWFDDAAMNAAPAEAEGLFESARRALTPYAERTRLADAGSEIFPGIVLEEAPGHTPGHSVLRVASGDDQLLIAGDIMHNFAIHTAEPDTGFAFDLDPEQAAQSRRRVFDMIAADRMLMAGTHLPFPGLGRVLAEGDAFRWVPAQYQYDL